MTGLALVDGEANEGEGGGGLAHRINSIVDHAINLNVRVSCFVCAVCVCVCDVGDDFVFWVSTKNTHTTHPFSLSHTPAFTHTQLDLARWRAFPAVDVTYQMNLQSPGTALLPEPTKALVQVRVYVCMKVYGRVWMYK